MTWISVLGRWSPGAACLPPRFQRVPVHAPPAFFQCSKPQPGQTIIHWPMLTVMKSNFSRRGSIWSMICVGKEHNIRKRLIAPCGHADIGCGTHVGAVADPGIPLEADLEAERLATEALGLGRALEALLRAHLLVSRKQLVDRIVVWCGVVWCDWSIESCVEWGGPSTMPATTTHQVEEAVERRAAVAVPVHDDAREVVLACGGLATREVMRQ